jgi:hypothetical protein
VEHERPLIELEVGRPGGDVAGERRLVFRETRDAGGVPEHRAGVVGHGDERAAHAFGPGADPDLQELAVERPDLLEDLRRLRVAPSGQKADQDPTRQSSHHHSSWAAHRMIVNLP